MNEEKTLVAPPESPTAEPSTRLAPAPRSRGKLFLILLAVFLSGAGVGVGGTKIAVENHWVHLFKHPPPPEDICQRFKTLLDLDEEQMAQVERIVQTRHETMERMRRETNDEMDRMDRQIEDLLRPEQQVKWRAWLGEMKRKWGPPPFGPKQGPPPPGS